jgi:hypothetical protein
VFHGDTQSFQHAAFCKVLLRLILAVYVCVCVCVCVYCFSILCGVWVEYDACSTLTSMFGCTSNSASTLSSSSEPLPQCRRICCATATLSGDAPLTSDRHVNWMSSRHLIRLKNIIHKKPRYLFFKTQMYNARTINFTKTYLDDISRLYFITCTISIYRLSLLKVRLSFYIQ